MNVQQIIASIDQTNVCTDTWVGLSATKSGRVEAIEYLNADGSQQRTTINGKAYRTAWVWGETDWKMGDNVEFEVSMRSTMPGMPPLPHADNVRKAG
jgi:hypothetical protein